MGAVDTAITRLAGLRGQPSLESPGTGYDAGSIHGFFDTVAKIGSDVIPLVNAIRNPNASDPIKASAIESPAAAPAPSGLPGNKWLWIGGGIVALLAVVFLIRRG